MTNLAEDFGLHGSAPPDANDKRAVPQPSGAVVMPNSPALASGYQELVSLIALYEDELRTCYGKEAQKAALDQVDIAASRALDTAGHCGEVLCRLIRSPSHGPCDVFTKADALFIALETVGLDQETLVSLGRYIQEDIARITPFVRSHPAEKSRWLRGLFTPSQTAETTPRGDSDDAR